MTKSKKTEKESLEIIKNNLQREWQGRLLRIIKAKLVDHFPVQLLKCLKNQAKGEAVKAKWDPLLCQLNPIGQRIKKMMNKS
jgi:hypothetical protein